ncbi:hypothetical protein MICAB_2910015 [Microcystis aeruginosa PCC 9717]|uniref:Uncharacterized protein n=1 Tax=Microcystis aeruginosa PCC 9717 TaxID=1160286 RepID=I4FN47_MICAE|nr:hypothetical protein MICAB_2910015 [Microcystis aeruginosa PCC 9717]
MSPTSICDGLNYLILNQEAVGAVFAHHQEVLPLTPNQEVFRLILNQEGVLPLIPNQEVFRLILNQEAVLPLIPNQEVFRFILNQEAVLPIIPIHSKPHRIKNWRGKQNITA